MRFASMQPRKSLVIVFSGIIAVAIALIGFYRPHGTELSSDQITGCAWFTSCWHEGYFRQFVHTGLVPSQQAEGEFLGLVSYQMSAITTQDLFTFFSLMLSVLVFLAGLQFGRMQQRRAYTTEAIMTIFSAEALAAANARIADLNIRVIKSGAEIDGNISGADDAALITMLDFYEFLCQGALEGVFNARTICDIRGGAMRTTFEKCERYIIDRRETLGRPKLYWAFEKFVREFSTKGDF